MDKKKWVTALSYHSAATVKVKNIGGVRHYLSINRVHVARVDCQTWTMTLIWGALSKAMVLSHFWLLCVNDNGSDIDIAVSWATSP